MRRYFLKVEVNGTWIPAESVDDSIQHHYDCLEDANEAAEILKDSGFNVRVDVSSD